MAGALRSRLMAERLARKSQDGTIGQLTEMHEDEMLKDMNINVGDVYYGAVPQEPQQQEPAQQPPPQETPQTEASPSEPREEPSPSQPNVAPVSNAKRMWPLLLSAALAGGGLGAGAVAIPYIMGDDTDTKYDLSISSGDLPPPVSGDR